MASRQANAADPQPAGNAAQVADKDPTGLIGFLNSLKTDEVTLYVHREDLGKHGYLSPPLKFNPTQHNIGHLYDVVLKRWGPGSYWVRTQAQNGSGFGPGSFTMDLADPTPVTPAPAPVAIPVPAQVVAAPAGAPQFGGDVNQALLLFVRELMQRATVAQAAPVDMGAFSSALQGALATQQQGIQAVTQRLDPNIQGFSIARELLKLSREMAGANQATEGAAPTGGMDPLMMIWMMMQGGGGGGGGNMQNMLPMMMMMNQGGGGGGGQQNNPMQMMQMMQMMQQAKPPQRPAPAAPPQRPQQPDPWGPFPGPWGETAAPPAPARTIADLERELAELRTREAVRVATPVTTTATTSTTSTTAPAPAKTPPNMLQLDGYGSMGSPFEMLATTFGVSPEEITAGMAEMTPEEQQAVTVLMK